MKRDSLPHSWRAALAICVLASALLLGACSAKRPSLPPADEVSMRETPDTFVEGIRLDTLELESWTDLGPSIRKSQAYVRRKPAQATAFRQGAERITWGEMKETLDRLQQLLPRLDKEPGLLLENFRWVAVDRGIKYSGYYEPRLKVSRKRTKEHSMPLYSLPPDIAAYKAGHGGLYYSRREIDGQGVLAGRGLELAWADPVDVFFLQIQGSGKIIFDDGTETYVNYAGQNGHKYISSGRIMRGKGVRFKSGDIFEQREWFKAHPDRIFEMLFDNPSYVFFKFGVRGSIGSMGCPIDDWISLATDPKLIPLGSIVAYGVNAPDPKKGRIPLRGVAFAQDTGGAIKDNRIDVFCGGSDRSNYVASKLDAPGPAWILVRR